MDTEYRIPINIELIATESKGTPSPTSKATPDQTQKKLANEASNEAGGVLSKMVAIQVGKQAINYGLQNYGNLTGDYITQSHLQTANQLGGTLLMAVKGGIAGMTIAAASLGFQVISYGIDVANRNREAQCLRERVGMASIYGGR
jgi:hypothetical protein